MRKFLTNTVAMIGICCTVNMGCINVGAANILNHLKQKPDELEYKYDQTDVGIAYEEDEPSTEETEYEFPYSIEKGNWDDLYLCDKPLEELQIPEDVIETISTEGLLQLLFKYPFICQIDNYDEMTIGYNKLKKEFNGINAFLSRDDAYNVLIKSYQQYQIPNERIVKYPVNDGTQAYIDKINEMVNDEEIGKEIIRDMEVYHAIDLMEMMLLELSDTEPQMERTNLAVNLKRLDKEKSEYFKDGRETYVSEQLRTNPYKASTANNLFKDIPLVFHTPKNIPYRAVYNGSTKENTYDNCYADLVRYKAELVELGTGVYNCHSYTFLKSTNPYYKNLWLSDPQPFFQGGYLKKVNQSELKAGDIIYTSQHSGIVLDPKRKYKKGDLEMTAPYIVNKLGGGAIVSQKYVASDQEVWPSMFSGEVKYYRVK